VRIFDYQIGTKQSAVLVTTKSVVLCALLITRLGWCGVFVVLIRDCCVVGTATSGSKFGRVKKKAKNAI
jgi:hypothetical protein